MSIGLSGIFAAQTALDIAGENITNSTTPGYARRQVQLAETASTGAKPHADTGVSAETIVRDRDMYLEGQVQSYNAGLSSATTMSQYLNQIQSLLQEPNSTAAGSARSSTPSSTIGKPSPPTRMTPRPAARSSMRRNSLRRASRTCGAAC